MRRGMSALAVVVLAAGPLAAQDTGPQLPGNRGLPRASGLDKTVVLANLPASDPGWTAVRKLAKHRKAEILGFSGSAVDGARAALVKAGVEHVILAVTPTTVDMNFHLDVLELCRSLDADPMPDFDFGYLCARDGKDLGAFVDRILAREAAPPAEPVTGLGDVGTGKGLDRFDAFLHFGHGNPWGVVQGLTAEDVSALVLPKAPVVISGACFTGVLSRSFHPCAYQLIYLPPETVAPERLISLAWVRAGVAGYLAALEGDRGENASMEWDYLRERACTLGETIGHQYRLAFTSVPPDFRFPRYVAGAQKDTSFYAVMLRGMVSRLLLGDPALVPFAKPLAEPAVDEALTFDAKTKTLTVVGTVRRWVQGRLQNCLSSKPGFFDQRVTLRIPLPEDLTGTLGPATVTAVHEGAPIELTRHHVRHEAWGGRRWLNLQVESEAALGQPGTTVTWTFAVKG